MQATQVFTTVATYKKQHQELATVRDTKWLLHVSQTITIA